MTQCAVGCLGGLMSYFCRSSLYFVYLHSVHVHSFIEFCRFHSQLQGLFSAGMIYVPCIRNKFKAVRFHGAAPCIYCMWKNYGKRNKLAPTGITQ
jgi:hypothetical protein